jgi:putative ABC transport system permease protein
VRAFRTLGTTLSRSDLGNRIVFPRLAEVRIDTVVLAYAAMLSIAAGIVFGLIPALRYSREGMTDALRESTTSARSRMKAVLVVAELALATLLLVSGGLLINSFARLATTDPGFDPSHVLTFQVSTSRPVEQLAFAEALTARLQSVPGITSAAYGRQLPMVNLQDSLRLTIRRNGVDETVDDSPDVRFVSRDYLKTLGVPVLAGRGLSEQDGSGGSPVIVVNESLARRDLRGVNPIGQMIVLGPPARRVAFEIVGVAGDVRQFALDRPAGSQYFIDTRQVPTDPAVRMPPLLPVGPYFLIRTANDPVTMAANIRDIAAQLSPGATLDHVATMDQIVSNSMTRPRMYAVLVSVFCGIAAVLAGVGLYGVMAYAVTQRTKEIGVRVALGAARRDVLVLILRDGMLLIGIGLVFGLASAAIVTRYMRDLLFGLTPLDPATFASVAAFVAAIAAVASYVPARRATSVDPLVALRHD